MDKSVGLKRAGSGCGSDKSGQVKHVLQISDKSVREVRSDMSCLGRTSPTACFLIKLQNYLAGFSKAKYYVDLFGH
jgi:hypothetical protein